MISPPTMTKAQEELRIASFPMPTIGICLSCGMSTDLTLPDHLPRHRGHCHAVTDPRTYAIEIVEWDDEKQEWL